MTTPIPPDTAAAGQTGHIAAHNAISDNLTLHQTQLDAVPEIASGTAALTAGTVSVTLPSISTGDAVLVSRMTPGGTLGHLSVPTVSNGSGFTITSSSSTETSVVAWLVLG